eukprot:scaffold6387_cov88-Cylindrotheca_fusiformis.AAC.1
MRYGTKKHVLVGCLALCVVLLLSLQRSEDSPRLFGQYLSTKNTYQDGQQIPIWILPLTSTSTRLPLPYDTSLFCDTAEENAAASLKPSRWIVGDDPVLLRSLDVKNLRRSDEYQRWCNKTLTEQSSSELKYLISNNYRQNVIVDNGLPAIRVDIPDEFVLGKSKVTFSTDGIPVGIERSREDGSNTSEFIVLNHWNIDLVLHEGQIVEFSIQTMSIDRRWWDAQPSDPGYIARPQDGRGYTRPPPRVEPNERLTQRVEPNETIVYTYQTRRRETVKPWSYRWLPYLENSVVPHEFHEFHVYSIMNQVFVAVLALILAVVNWVRVQKHNSKLTQPHLAEEKGESSSDSRDGEKRLCGLWSSSKKGVDRKWRLLHGDIFRPPSFSPISLAIACGTGAQLLSSTIFVCVLCFLGIVTPIYKGTFFVGPVLSYAFVGSWIGGYVTSIVYQQVQLEASNIERKRMAVLCTACLFPGVLFLFFLLLNEWARAMNSTMARPLFPDILLLIILWLCVFVPMTQRGAEAGFRLGIAPFPVETSDEVRDIPKGNLGRKLLHLSSGVLVCMIFCMENYILISHFFGGLYYDSYGFLAIIVCVMIAACASCSVVMTFDQLSSENHRWWWSSFGNGASVGIFAWLIYCYCFFKVDRSFGSYFAYVLYFGVTLIVSVGLSLAFGCVSFFSALYLNRCLYAAMKAGE